MNKGWYSFEIVESKVRSRLVGNIPETYIPAILRLLRKGGKAVYRAGDTATIIEINPTTGEIDTLLEYQD